MPRMKIPNVGLHEEVEEEDLTTRYEAPFHVRTEHEGDLYTKFSKHFVINPRYFDWDLLRDLKIVAKVTKYLKVLGFEDYAKNVDFSGYEALCYEFLCTMYVIDDKKKIGVRMNGRDYQINLTKMKNVFGFPTGGERDRPPTFSVEAAWNELTRFDNWDSSGRPNGYIQDPTLAVVHKFLSYNVSGKEQGNKVNANEVYLLHCALKGKKVCISNFIWATMKTMQTRAGMHPSLAPIVTGAYSIDFSELKGAQIISDRFTLVLHSKRPCVSRQINANIARVQGDAGVGSSTGGERDVEMEEEEGEEEEEQPQQPPFTMPEDFYAQFQNDMRAHNDASFGSLRQHIDDRYDAHTQEMYARFDAHIEQMNARFNAHDAQIASLQAQWDAWTAFYPPPHPPPHN
ncbi:hypothetical protein C2S51_024429 [Perilla frutescens var. frutescens]|nr:hypothetical protein C2S51_024429 [Perilla frutescens var. frutescens]